MGIRLTEEEYAALIARRAAKGNNRAAVSTPYMEHSSESEPSGPNAVEEIHPRVCIHVHSRRRRLADPDGISIKAALDGLVRGGLLADDSAKEVESVTFSQEKSEVEETVIEIWEVEGVLR